MLTIREEQMATFSALKLQQLEDMMLQDIAAEFPEKYKRWGELRTRDFIRKGVEIGRQNGVTQPGALVGLIELMAQFGAQFELCPEQDWAREMLAHETLPGDAKIQIIAERFHELSGGRTIEEVEDDEVQA